MKVLCLILAAAAQAQDSAVANSCNLKESVFADMHDGDEKVVSIQDGTMIITSAYQKFVTPIDCSTHKAMVNASWSGHAPVPIQATLYTSWSVAGEKTTIIFTDTNGQLVDNPEFPLNQWVQETPTKPERKFRCPTEVSLDFQDVHDGDAKHVEIKGEEMIITPVGSDPHWGPVAWKVKAKFDQKSCSALVDFDVAGKTDHPPVPLLATYWFDENQMAYAKEYRETLEFTDPSGTLAEASMPLNRWIQQVDDAVIV